MTPRITRTSKNQYQVYKKHPQSGMYYGSVCINMYRADNESQ